ncbi:hypothetical protein BDN71DRAFT_1512772 [Pleurotus eryngii]|uniref:Uncharacterized protein n=1 Tax=Pleurotus eryngii TaxID=5323 RepID=A0A9P5ZMZ2_PLEER|nr:hypothetical protein BDN71DRAFT_1512772 [Pleurotus eryngii]
MAKNRPSSVARCWTDLLTFYPCCVIVPQLCSQWDRLNHDKELHWSNQRKMEDKSYVNTDIYFRSLLSRKPVATQVAYVTTAVMQHFYFVSRRALRLQLSGLRDLMGGTATIPTEIAELISGDPRTATSHLHIDPVLRTFICCTSCHSIYPYNPNEPSNPPRCVGRRAPESAPCAAQLWKETIVGGRQRLVPCMLYQHQDFKHWLARILARKGIDDLLDSYPSELCSEHQPISDIWLANILSQLKGHDGNPFSGPGRLVFGLSVDSFEPNAS